jgi:hypothetical protein
MLGTNIARAGWPACGEIDIMENVGFDPLRVHASVHTAAYNHTIGTQKTASTLVPDPAADFHVYAMEWYPDRIETIVDACAPQGSLSLGPATLTLIDPGAVPGLVVTKTNGGADLHLGWGVGANATGYTVFQDGAPSGTFAAATGSASSGADGLTIPMPAGNVYYLVAATNTCGTGPKH